MVMKVLQSMSEIHSARQELIQKKVSCVDSWWQKIMRRLGLMSGVAIGDKVKSWDVMQTLAFIEENLNKKAAVLDIGCYASEILMALSKAGFTNLSGADLNPELKKMPLQDEINYRNINFMHTDFPDASFDMVTSISVIEHGYNPEALLSEISRLLKNEGFFIASFDYWPDKIDTKQIKFFGMDWLIFSQKDIQDLINIAGKYGLVPYGEVSYSAKHAPIECGGKKYTFGWVVFRKKAQ